MTEVPGVPTKLVERRSLRAVYDSARSESRKRSGSADPRTPSADNKPFAVIATSFNEAQGQLSPDGRWVASYPTKPLRWMSTSDPSRRMGVPRRRRSGSSRKVLGLSPRWRSDGKQLFYVSMSTFGLTACDVDTAKGFQALTTRRLFTAPPPLIAPGWNLSPDDKRFLFVTSPSGGRTAPFTVVLNWPAMLKK